MEGAHRDEQSAAAAELCQITGPSHRSQGSEAAAALVVTVEPKQAEVMMRLANKVAPLADLAHLKRIRSFRDETDGQHKLFMLLGVDTPELRSRLNGVVDVSQGCTVKVASDAPTTQEQWDAAAVLWPLSLPRPRVDPCCPSQLPAGDVNFWVATMRLCWEKGLEAKRAGFIAIGAAVVNTEQRRIVAVATGTLRAHHYRESVVYVKPDMEMCSCDPAATGGMHAAFEAVRLASIASTDDAYLCNGLDVITNIEPCLMCTMAMIHSRVRRMICTRTNDRNGGCSLHSLHDNPSLNHRFQAYSGLCSKEFAQECLT